MVMPIRAIIQLGDPMLRAVSTPVHSVAQAAAIFDDLRDTLHEFRRTHDFGRGISAVQIGEPKRLIYIEAEGRAWRLRNPAYEYRGEERRAMWDACFSFPELRVWLERSVMVRIRYEDENGVGQMLEASDGLSELLQHEMDHLDGVLAVDRAMGPNGLATREEYERRYLAAGQGRMSPGPTEERA